MEWSLAVVSLTLLAVAAISGRLYATPFTPAMTFVAVGWLVGLEGLDGIDLETAGPAKSQLSSLVVAVLTVITLLFLTGLFEELPRRCWPRSSVCCSSWVTICNARAHLVLARQVGQVRDILSTEQRPTAIEIYPSVQAVVDAIPADSQAQRQ